MPNLVPAIDRRVVSIWANAIKQCIINTKSAPTVNSRAMAMMFEAMYNAWTIYQNPDIVKPSINSKTLYSLQKNQIESLSSIECQMKAISYAAYRVLLNLFPTQESVINSALNSSAEDLEKQTPKTEFVLRAQRDGLAIGLIVINYYSNDGSNQANNYADTTGYVPVAVFDTITDTNNVSVWADTSKRYKWMPLKFINQAGATVTQTALTPQWGFVKPFALPYGSFLRPDVRIQPTQEEIDEVLQVNANLTEAQKVQAELYAKGPGTESPPGMWLDIADQISIAENNNLEKDIKLFFALAMAVFDAGIAAWDVKYAYNTIRPLTLIRNVYRGQNIEGWGGPGTTSPASIDGKNWKPYQPSHFMTPPFPEVVSGHSTFSSAAATVIAAMRKSDKATFKLTMSAGGIPFDPTFPANAVEMNYTTLSKAATDAGYSRILGGIHFAQGNNLGSSLGKSVGLRVYDKCLSLFKGYVNEQ